MKKKVLSILMTAMMALSLAACGNADNSAAPAAGTDSQTQASTESAKTEADLFPTLKPIDIEFAHVAPDTLKTLDQLTICHEIHLLQFMASFYHRRCPNERTAPCQLRSGMGLNQFFADF